MDREIRPGAELEPDAVNVVFFGGRGRGGAHKILAKGDAEPELLAKMLIRMRTQMQCLSTASSPPLSFLF